MLSASSPSYFVGVVPKVASNCSILVRLWAILGGCPHVQPRLVTVCVEAAYEPQHLCRVPSCVGQQRNK